MKKATKIGLIGLGGAALIGGLVSLLSKKNDDDQMVDTTDLDYVEEVVEVDDDESND